MKKKLKAPPVRLVAGLLKARMYAAGVTQRDIAEAVGVTSGLVSMVINGKRKNDKILTAIAEATRDVDA